MTTNRIVSGLSVLLLAFGLTVLGCSKPEDKIVGSWGVDVDATAATDAKMKAMPEDQRKAAVELFRGLFKDATFEFTKDGKMIASVQGKKEEGTFVVKSAEGNQIVLSTKSKDGKDEEMTVEASDGKLVLTTKGESLYLVKK